MHAVVNDNSSLLVTSTTCTTRTCIEYDYMHVRTLYATNYAECSI